MDTMISATAQIDKSAMIGENVRLEDNVVVHAGVVIGKNTIIKSGTEIFECCCIGEGCRIGRGSTLKSRTNLAAEVIIGEETYIDLEVIIRDKVTIGKKSYIGARCILGEYLLDFFEKKESQNFPLYIGEEALIRSETIIYGQNQIGDFFQTGHRVTIREKSRIGNHVRIGTLSDIQGDCEIQDYVNMHSNVHIGQKSLIKKYAWIFPYVVLTNDPNPPSEKLLGVTVEEFAVVATGTVILPGITIGSESLVGAGAIVTKNVEARKVAVGNPARTVGEVEDIKSKPDGSQVYPWQNSFDRGMPWQGIGYENWRAEYKEL